MLTEESVQDSADAEDVTAPHSLGQLGYVFSVTFHHVLIIFLYF